MTHNWTRQCSSACKQKLAAFHNTLATSSNSRSCVFSKRPTLWRRTGQAHQAARVELWRAQQLAVALCFDLLPETALALLSQGGPRGGDGAWGEERPRRSPSCRRSGAVMRQSNACRLHQRWQWDVCSPAAWQTATACGPPAARGARLCELGAAPAWPCPSPLAV